jgi:hypothetical protein
MSNFDQQMPQVAQPIVINVVEQSNSCSDLVALHETEGFTR